MDSQSQKPITGKMIGSFLILAIALFSSDCSPSSGRSEYHNSLTNAIGQVPYAKEFVRLFPVVYASLSQYGESYGPELLNVEAAIRERYIVRLKVPVVFDTNGLFQSCSEPKFALHEVASVEELSDERWEVTFQPETSRNFGTNEWNRLKTANGDLSVLGVTPDGRSVPNFSRFWKKHRPNTRVK